MRLKGSPIQAIILGKCHLPHLEKAPCWKKGGKKGPLSLTVALHTRGQAESNQAAGGAWVALEVALRKQQTTTSILLNVQSKTRLGEQVRGKWRKCTSLTPPPL